MRNRQQRRASVADFKKAAAGGYLDAHLAPADVPITDPLLQRAAEFWRGHIQQRRPVCIACKAKFAEDARPGAYLFTLPSRAPSSCSTSALCDDCWLRLSDDEVKAVALRVVRRIMPWAVFDPEPPR